MKFNLKTNFSVLLSYMSFSRDNIYRRRNRICNTGSLGNQFQKYFAVSLCIFFCFGTSFLPAQINNCESDPYSIEFENSIGPLDCTLDSYDEKCVKVKFHFLNNTSGPMEDPDDAYFFDFIQKVNEVLEPGKIRLTLADGCVHRQNLTIPINSPSAIYSYWLARNDELLWDSTFINIYILQHSLGVPLGFYHRRYMVASPLDTFQSFMHELGHVLGNLNHTFQPETGPLYELGDMCKNPLDTNASGQLLCEISGDNICDTGLDPKSFDLDGDSIADGSKWVDLETCQQRSNLLASYEDGCGDTTTAWNIPINNFMSYYYQCMTEYTPCQFARMHDVLPVYLFNTSPLLDCAEDPYAIEIEECDAQDIIIDSIVVWENLTKELCPGQKIVITRNGKLTIDRCTITRKNLPGPNIYCPNLYYDGMWDGIYIKGKGSTVLYNGQNVTLGSLVIKNNSVISYSKNGIQAINGFSKVEVSGSVMNNNLTCISLRDTLNHSFLNEGSIITVESFTNGSNLCGYSIFNPYPEVLLSNSTFTVGLWAINYPSETQIKVNGGTLRIHNCEISNPNVLNDLHKITAVKSARGKLSIVNGSKINNFDVGVFKAADIYNNCSPRGLYVHNSTISNSVISIHNTSQYVLVKGNMLEGNIKSEGLSYSSWLSNNIKTFDSTQFQSIVIQSPTGSNYFSENLLTKQTIDFYGDNHLSYSLCNTWKSMNEGYAVVGNTFATLPLAWGSRQQASGNRHLDDEDLPILFAEDEIRNYHKIGIADQLFTYEFLITEATSDNDTICEHDYPILIPSFSSSFSDITYNFTTENTNWTDLNTLKSQKEALLPHVSSGEQILLREQLNEIGMKMAEIVRRVLSTISPSDESIENNWLSRSNSGIIDLSELLALWYSHDFDEIETHIGITNDDDAETLISAADFLSGVSSRNKTLYDLSDLELDTLTEIATLSFGNYTNILRDFLSLTYNIDLYWPVEENGVIPRSTHKSIIDKYQSEEYQFSIYPNPSYGCFSIIENKGTDKPFLIQVYDLQGKISYNKTHYNNDAICLDMLVSGIYILKIGASNSDEIETHKIVIY